MENLCACSQFWCLKNTIFSTTMKLKMTKKNTAACTEKTEEMLVSLRKHQGNNNLFTHGAERPVILR